MNRPVLHEGEISHKQLMLSSNFRDKLGSIAQGILTIGQHFMKVESLIMRFLSQIMIQGLESRNSRRSSFQKYTLVLVRLCYYIR